MERQADPTRALAGLRERWGAAAPRRGTEVFGALAAAPLPADRRRSDAGPVLRPLSGPGGATETSPRRDPVPGDAIPTGFADLDALLAGGGLPRAGTVALAGSGSSGVTTLAMRALAGAQEAGALAAWIDLTRSLDPVEAVARGVRLEWLAVLTPDGLGQALAMAGTLLQSRAVNVLVLDLGPGREAAAGRPTARGPADGRARGRPATRPVPRPAEQLVRLAAFARRAGALLLVLVAPGTAPALRAAVDEGAGLRLELRRRGWIRLGREVVGQRTEVCIAKDRHAAPDRRVGLRILYAEGGPRDRCLARDELLAEEPVAHPSAATRFGAAAAGSPPGLHPIVPLPFLETLTSNDAPPPPLLAPPRAPARRGEQGRSASIRTADPRRAAVG